MSTIWVTIQILVCNFLEKDRIEWELAPGKMWKTHSFQFSDFLFFRHFSSGLIFCNIWYQIIIYKDKFNNDVLYNMYI